MRIDGSNASCGGSGVNCEVAVALQAGAQGGVPGDAAGSQ